MFNSIAIPNTIEVLPINTINPLIDKVKIKVCYVQDEPNRNMTILTEEQAREVAKTLPGSPIVAYYNETKEDFEEHNEFITIKNNKIMFDTNTIPYGFVDVNAKVWFEMYQDETVQRKYLCTEGYVWSGQFPEIKALFEEGRPHSLEFDKPTFKGVWSKDENTNESFFIINEAIISKLCVMGEDIEPCFEGASVTAYSLEDNFKNTMFSFIKEMKNILSEGGTSMTDIPATKYAVEIGDALWSALYSYLEEKYPENPENEYSMSKYCIRGIYEEGTQKFVILRDRADSKMYKVNFTYTEEGLTVEENFVEVEIAFVEANGGAHFTDDEIVAYETTRYAKKDDEEKKDEEKEQEEEKEEDEPTDPEEKPEEEEKKKEKTSYSLDEIPEYVSLKVDYDNLLSKFSLLQSEHEAVLAENSSLSSYKKEIEKTEKEALILKFSMLSDEDKADVVAKIDEYSLDEIESILSVTCFRKGVSFNNVEEKGSMTYNINVPTTSKENNKPAWLQAVDNNMK